MQHSDSTVSASAGIMPVLVLGLILLLSSCASAPQSASIIKSAPLAFTTPVLLQDIPYFPQDLYQCGPAALATLLGASGLAISPETLVPQIYVPARKGAFQAELLAATRAQGRLAYELSPTLEVLLTEVTGGHPVLVLQNLGVNWYQKWHYAVVKGYDLQRRVIIMNSGTRENYEVSLRAFENTWARSGHWAMLALVPGQVPLTAQPLAYFNAVVDLEALNSSELASTAYASGLARWPSDRTLLMGYGNLQYATQQLAEAKTLFLTAALAYPDYAPAYNNLAQVEYELGNLQPAQTYARQALALGGRYADNYRQTLQTITAGSP